MTAPAPSPPITPAPSRPLGVYIHFPWCLKKCPYCDFLSVAAARDAIPHRAYADAVLRELAARLPRIAPGSELQTVFFGGGTPSLWATDELGRVLEGVLEAFRDRRAADVEITAECNPTSLDFDKAQALRAVGVNRLSLGVQGLDAERLAFLGRLHDPAGGLDAARAALTSDMPRVSVDFIFGVAGQSARDAAAEAARLAALGTTHVSAYALTIEPGTEFGARAKKGRLPLLDEAMVADSFTAVDETLTKAGFDHYEISNFARDGHVSRHNLGYWRGYDYLGLGTGAWGTVTLPNGRLRYRSNPSPERYQAQTFAEPFTEGAEAACGVLEPLDAETSLRERIMLGLRLAEGFDLEAAAAELGTEALPADRARELEKLLERGSIERLENGRLRVPRQRWLLADGIISRLL